MRVCLGRRFTFNRRRHFHQSSGGSAEFEIGCDVTSMAGSRDARYTAHSSVRPGGTVGASVAGETPSGPNELLNSNESSRSPPPVCGDRTIDCDQSFELSLSSGNISSWEQTKLESRQSAGGSRNDPSDVAAFVAGSGGISRLVAVLCNIIASISSPFQWSELTTVAVEVVTFLALIPDHGHLSTTNALFAEIGDGALASRVCGALLELFVKTAVVSEGTPIPTPLPRIHPRASVRCFLFSLVPCATVY